MVLELRRSLKQEVEWEHKHRGKVVVMLQNCCSYLIDDWQEENRSLVKRQEALQRKG